MQTIQQIFDKKFAHWEIVLPADSLVEKPRGSLNGRGWTINYQLGSKAGILYLEYFTSHRMSNDALNRIYADGREELVGYCQEFYRANDEQARQARRRHNREFYVDVKRRGLA